MFIGCYGYMNIPQVLCSTHICRVFTLLAFKEYKMSKCADDWHINNKWYEETENKELD